MSQKKKTIPLEWAQKTARDMLFDIMPFCERGYCEVVGSVRREAPIVGDIEFLYVPIPHSEADLFGTMIPSGNEFHLALPRLLRRWKATIISGGDTITRIQTSRTTIEFYKATRQTWGVEQLIRTGPSEFSTRAVTQRNKGGYLPSYACVQDGWKVMHGNNPIEMQREEDFLNFLGIGWVEPQNRTANLEYKQGV